MYLPSFSFFRFLPCIRYVATLLILVSFIGCATKGDQKEAYDVQSVGVSSRVPLPERMDFVGLTQTIGMSMGGLAAIGGIFLVMENTFQKEADKSRESFNLANSVFNDFSSELKKRFPTTYRKERKEAEAYFKLKLESYGFLQIGGLARRVRPHIEVQGILIRDGVTLWVGKGTTEGLEAARKTLPARIPSEWLKKPERMQEGLREAIKLAVGNLLDRFQGQSTMVDLSEEELKN